jgi:single-strand DNA-binding protein
MASFNRVILMGNVTRDPELRYIPSGKGVCELGLAVNNRFKGQDGNFVEETTFVDVTLWGRTAEIATEYLSKGSPVLIEGRLKLDSWEKDGKKNYKLRVVGETMQLLGQRGQGGGAPGGGGGGGERSERQERPASRGPAPARGKPAPAKSNAPPSDDYYQDYEGPDDGGQGGPQDDIPF